MMYLKANIFCISISGSFGGVAVVDDMIPSPWQAYFLVYSFLPLQSLRDLALSIINCWPISICRKCLSSYGSHYCYQATNVL